jgi:hypothetical protein
MAFDIASPREWYQEIMSAREEHHKPGRLLRMRDASMLYRNGSHIAKYPDGSRNTTQAMVQDVGGIHLRVNITQAIVDNIVSQLLPEEVRASFLPRFNDPTDKAFKTQSWMNWLIREAGLDLVWDDATRKNAIYGDGFVKIGMVDVPKRREIEDVETLLTEGEYASQIGGDLGIEGEALYRRRMVWGQSIHPDCIIPAPGALSIHDTPYLVQKIRRRLDHVLVDGNYNEKARAVLRPMILGPGEEPENENRDEAFTSEPGDQDISGTDWVDLFEIWDYYNRELRVVAVGNTDQFLRVSEWPFPGLEGYPFVHLQFKNDPESFFGIPLITDIADLQEELNTVSSFMLEAFKRSVPFNLYDKSRLGPKKADSLSRAELQEFIGVDGDPNTMLAQYPKVGSMFSPDIYGVRNMIIQAMMLITGMTDFMLGQSQKTKSATEAALTGQSSSTRMKYRSRIFRRFLRDTIRKAWQIMAPTMDETQWVRQLGAKGAEMLPVTPEDVRGEYDIDIDAQIFDDRMQDPVRLKLIVDAMAPMLQNPQVMLMTGINPVEMMKRYLQAIGERNIEKLQPISATPVDADTENQVMANGNAVEVHPLDDDIEHLQSHLQAQLETPVERHILFEEHIKKHSEMMQLKQQLIQQQAGGGGGSAGNGGAGIEAPSRRSTPNLGEQSARAQQVTNQ